MKKINIMGISVASLRKDEAIRAIREYLADGKKHFIATVNPEMILASDRDEEFFYILNEADLALPDGIGLKFAAWVSGKNLVRITGADLVKDVLAIAEELKLKVTILNWEKSLSKNDDIARALRADYGKLEFEILTVGRDHKDIDAHADGDIIIANQGAPFQEKLIFHHLKNWPKAKLAIGVGGALDFLTRKITRAPGFMRLFGLEWLWRLIIEPKVRWKRIINAVIIFPYQFIQWKFVYPRKYRPNVVCLVYKIENGEKKILLVERSDQAGHWQMPQGGTDGLPIKIAALKEISEELGTDKAEIKKIYKNIYKYKFEDRVILDKTYANLSQRHRGYKGQKQSLAIAEFRGKENDLKLKYWDHQSFKWVPAERLVEEAYLVRREGYKIFLEKFSGAVK